MNPHAPTIARVVPAKSDLALEQFFGCEQLITRLFIILLCGWCGIVPAHAALHSGVPNTPAKSGDFRGVCRDPYHNPETGRFWTQDSYEGFGSDPSSLHKYAYCHNNPVNAFDPSGQMSLSEVSLSVQAWAITLTLTYPSWSRAFLFAANMLAPAEVQFGLPWLPTTKGLPLKEAYVRAKEALNLRMAWEFYRKNGKTVLNMKNGLSFQEWLGKVLNLTENREAYLNGLPTTGRPSSSVVPDFTANGGSALIRIIESKSASASVYQASGFAEIARQQGVSVNYIFLVKPDQGTVDGLKGAMNGADLTIHWLFSNASDAP